MQTRAITETTTLIMLLVCVCCVIFSPKFFVFYPAMRTLNRLGVSCQSLFNGYIALNLPSIISIPVAAHLHCILGQTDFWVE